MSMARDLYVGQMPGAIGLAYLLSGDRAQAEDLAQEAWVRVGGRFRRPRAPEALASSLRRTVIGLFLSHHRRARAGLRNEGVEGSEGNSDVPDVGGGERLWEAIGQVTARQRAAVVLRYFEDLSERQVADVMGISAPAARSLMARAMETVGRHIGGEEEMTDLEGELTDLFRRRVLGLGPLRVPPSRVRRRVRVRQARVVLAALLVVAGAVFGSFAGVRALTGRTQHPVTLTKERAVSFTSGGVTLSHPTGWQAVLLLGDGALYTGRPDVTSVLPILQLTNFSTVSSGGPVCPNRPGPQGAFPSWGVLLYVEQDMAFPAATPSSPSWPVQAEPSQPDPVPADVCLDGAGRIRWYAAGRTFEARLMAGPEASVTDKATLVAAFESMRFRPLDWPEGHYGRLVVPLGPSVTIAEGEVRGDRWVLLGEPADAGTCLHIEFAAGTEGFTFGCSFLAEAIGRDLPKKAITLDSDAFRRPGATDVDFFFGAVVPEAVRVVADLGDGRNVEAITQPVPFDPSIRAVVVPIVTTNRAIRATLTVLDAGGRVLARTRVDLSPSGV
jgi:RNA polymerase sigma factor (sigma-70 family)